MTAPATPPIVLSFAASDPTGGAGIQADLLTIAAMGCHPLSVITGLTVQDTSGVEAIQSVAADWVRDQARRVLEDMPVAAFKVGFAGSLDNIAAIAAIVADYPQVPLIVDPVLASGRGDPMAGDEMIAGLRRLLLPLTTVLTPNSPEARRVSTDDAGAEEDASLAQCAARIVALGCRYVLVTGTHENTAKVVNTLYDVSGVVRADAWDRLPGSYHGSGCTLASAIAAAVARGIEIPQAVHDAQDYTWRSLAAGFRPGMGQFVPDRLFWAREEATDPSR